MVEPSDGLGGDTRDLHTAALQGHPGARLALDVLLFRLRQEIAATAAACLPRLDVLAFTGDIGEDDPKIRQAVCDGLATLGLDDLSIPHRTPTDSSGSRPADRL